MAGLVLVTVVLIIYTPALHNDFVNWVDNEYVYGNAHISSLNIQSLYWMLTAFYSDNWHPLTWLSHAADVFFWKLNPFGHHLTNVLLHGLNTLLVLLLTVRLIMRSQEGTGSSGPVAQDLARTTPALRTAVIAALLFGLHPLHVESVAWVAERKDLLCAFFFLLSLLAYLSYALSRANRHHRLWFAACLGLFTFALLAKPMAVTLPAVLLLLDLYPLKRIRRHGDGTAYILLEKTPFFILSAASGMITIAAQSSGGAMGSLEVCGMNARLLNAMRSLVFYAEKMIAPAGLVPFYPFPPRVHWLDMQYVLSGLLCVSFTGLSVWMARKGRYLFLVAGLYYVVTLLPVLGIVQVGKQAAADRYTYLPSLGPFLLAALGTVWLWGRAAVTSRAKIVHMVVPLCICLVLSLLGFLTVQQIRIWRDSEVMWKQVITAFPTTAPTAYNNLGTFYVEKGRLEDAVRQFKQAIHISPQYAKAYNNLAWIYATAGNDMFRNGEEAIALATKACELTQFRDARFLDTLAAAHAAAGSFEQALVYQQKAIDLSQQEARAVLRERLELYRSGQPYRSP
jgi:Tfp pilus assembly protein PilF